MLSLIQDPSSLSPSLIQTVTHVYSLPMPIADAYKMHSGALGGVSAFPKKIFVFFHTIFLTQFVDKTLEIFSIHSRSFRSPPTHRHLTSLSFLLHTSPATLLKEVLDRYPEVVGEDFEFVNFHITSSTLPIR